MLRHKQRRQVFHGGQRSAQIIQVSSGATTKRSKRVERAQVGYQLKHLRAQAFKYLPHELQTPELRKAMYDLSPIDKKQVIKRPTITGLRNVNDNVVTTQYHDGENLVFDRKKLLQVLTFVPNKDLRGAIVELENRYVQLTDEIRSDQMPQIPEFPRPITSRRGPDLVAINEQFKMPQEIMTPQEILKTKKNISRLDDVGKLHVQKLTDLYKKLDEIDTSSDPHAQLHTERVIKQIMDIDFHPSELALLQIPDGVKAAPALTARVYKMMAHPIDYLELYRTVFRGKQPTMSKKLLHEINVMRYAVEHLTDEEFKQVNPHRVALMVWKLMNSGDVDDDSVETVLRCIHRMPDHDNRPLIHHNPEIMADSWIVEAFNNRHNPLYSQELIKGAKAADSDLNRFKLYLHDTEKVPRRLAIFLGMHYLKAKRTIPAYGLEPFFHALNYCRYPGQVNTVLNHVVTGSPDLQVPPGAIFEAMVAAHKLDETSTVEALSNYVRHTTGVGPDRVLPMNYRIGSIYIDSLQRRSKTVLKQYDADIETETTAVLKDMIARGQVPHVFTQDIIDAFLLPDTNPHTGQPIDMMPLLGGNTDARFAETSTDNVNNRAQNFHQLWVKQQEQDAKLTSHLKTFNLNIQSHVLPAVAFTAINYALRTLRNFAIDEGLMFRKPVRLYVPNMKSTAQEFNRKTLATDRYNDAADSHQINLDMNGQPMRKVINARTGEQEPFGVADMAQIPKDEQNYPTLPDRQDDANEEFKSLSRVMDAVDMFDHINEELRTPINPHVAHLVEQAIPTIAFNPHIYEDVLDIIHIKTGLSPYGEEKIGGFSGLRNPDKIDEYFAQEIKLILQTFGLTATMNKRFGYFEISVNELNRFITTDPDVSLRNANIAHEKFLLEQERRRGFVERAKVADYLSPLDPPDDDFSVTSKAMNGVVNQHAYQRQQLLTMKYTTPSGKPLSDEQIFKFYTSGSQDYEPSHIFEKQLEDLKLGLNDTTPTPFSVSHSRLKW